jgi:hypothetical protein
VTLRDFSREAAAAGSCGRQPADRKSLRIPKPRSGDSSLWLDLVSPLRGSMHFYWAFFPWAYAHGYLLPPLRG